MGVGCSSKISGFQSQRQYFTSREVLGKLGNMSKFITSKMEKITIFTSYTTLRIEADNDNVKNPESKYL